MERLRAHRGFTLAAALAASVVSVAAAGCEGCGTPAAVSGDELGELRIPVTFEGEKITVIDAPALGRKPDFDDGDRRAWLLTTLVGDPYEPSLGVEVESEDGTRTLVQPAGGMRPGQAVVLAVNRTGDVRVATVDTEDPFPPFHGRGGNRRRGGDPSRVREVKRIVLTHAATPTDAASFSIAILVEGDRHGVWDMAALSRVEQVELRPEDGEGERMAWSLRALSRTLLGPDYRPIEVTATGERRVEISREEWDDTSKDPVLYANRRGLLKFQWLEGGQASAGSDELREVSSLRFERTP